MEGNLHNVDILLFFWFGSLFGLKPRREIWNSRGGRPWPPADSGILAFWRFVSDAVGPGSMCISPNARRLMLPFAAKFPSLQSVGSRWIQVTERPQGDGVGPAHLLSLSHPQICPRRAVSSLLILMEINSLSLTAFMRLNLEGQRPK